MTTKIVATAFGGPEVLQAIDIEVAAPTQGRVTIEVRAIGVNPADYKGFSGARGKDESTLPLPVGFELAGVLTAIGPETEIASGGGAVGDEVLAFRVVGGYVGRITLPARNVFAKPANLDFPEAANLLLAGATAAEMLDVVGVSAGQTIVVHGASGAVGVSVLQQAALLGARVIGTASESSFDTVRQFGGEPVVYGDGLEQRIRDLAPDGIDAALDTVGTDEAVDVSLALVPNEQLVTIAAFPRAQSEGFHAIGGQHPSSAEFRDAVRPRLIALAAEGKLVVPIARTYPLTEAAEALTFLQQGHPGGKLALIP